VTSIFLFKNNRKEKVLMAQLFYNLRDSVNRKLEIAKLDI